MKKFYISTSIAYASKPPHVGNDYEVVLADAIARFKRLDGYDVYFQTGTDEHGLKIETESKKEGIHPKEHVDMISSEIKNVYKQLDISYDAFVRTTDERHVKVVQNVFKKLFDQGDIYLGKYSGWYSVAEEAYIFDKDQIESGVGPSGDKLIWTEEETYFLNLAKYQQQLIKHIEDNPRFIQPETRRNEMLNFLKEPLRDLSVTRTTLEWGIETFDKKHVIYVWIDALTNYISGFDLDDNFDSEKMRHYWPADVHVIGKDILRFHTIYWPIMLLALDIPLPKVVFGHPWILMNKSKMSKSLGNTLYTREILNHFHKDTLRYYMLHEIPYAQDGNLTYELLININNSDLANTLGNLVNRTIGMANKYRDGVIKRAFTTNPYEINLKEVSLSLYKNVKEKMDGYKVGDALEEIMKVLRLANKYVDVTEPWKLRHENPAELDGVLYEIVETIRFCAVMLQPFLPETSMKIFNQINTDKHSFKDIQTFGLIEDNHTLNKAEVLFERFDLDKKLLEIIEDNHD
ncbi:MAG: methionine--tRNA ligase [Acholeplasmataceae bacterium]